MTGGALLPPVGLVECLRGGSQVDFPSSFLPPSPFPSSLPRLISRALRAAGESGTRDAFDEAQGGGPFDV